MLSSQPSDETRESEHTRNGKPFSFSDKLNGLGEIDALPKFRFRWNSNEEVFTILTSLEKHQNWIADEVNIRPPNGSQLLYNRANFKTRTYHNDKYCWKTRKNSKSSRVDHSSLRIRGLECIYCSYVHSALVPTFHRRCYWLFENPDIVLVHYLNLPDKTTTHEQLVSSLLPFRQMQEQELLNQLQPILMNSGDKEDNNQKIACIDIDKLISEVKRYKESKPKRRANNKKTPLTNKLQVTSSKLRHTVPSHTITRTSQDTDKCSNCNQHLIIKPALNDSDSSHLNTNVAVTINKLTNPEQRMIKPPITADKQTQMAHVSRASFTPTVDRGIPCASSIHHEQLPATERTDLNGNLPCSEVAVNGFHDVTLTSHHDVTLTSLHDVAVTSHRDPCRLNNDLLVLDYDGLNDDESNLVNLFDSDLLDYLPDYISEVQPRAYTSGTFPTPQILSGHPNTTVNCTLGQQSTSNNVISNPVSFSSSSFQGGVTNNPVSGNFLGTSSQPITGLISTDCHTFGRLNPTPFELGSKAFAPAVGYIETSAVNGHQCSSTSSPQAPRCLNMKSVGYPAPTIAVFPAESTQTLTETGSLNNGVSTDRVPSCEPGYHVNTRPATQSTGNESYDIITEFSPEWSYCDGKTKVLILGHWSHQDGSYSCLFDGCSVPATLIQPGVLRCFCPPHEAGLVALQVAWNEFIVSNACVFEYKTRENATNSVQDWLGLSDVDLKTFIVERIERLETALNIDTASGSGDSGGHTGNSVEDRIVRICEVLLGRSRSSGPVELDSGTRGLSLLHLAAALGYTRLIQFLRQYACAQPSQSDGIGSGDVMTLTAEWAPHSKDSFGCTPLMWACWRGHEDSVLALLAWEPSSYDDCDNSGRSPKAMAQEMGHGDLARKMEEFVCCTNDYLFVLDNSTPSPSSSCAYLSVSSNEQVPTSPMSAQSLTWEKVEGSSEDCSDFEMASVTSEDRPNTLGKVLVEIRTLIQEAEERARSTQSPIQSPDNSTPFTVGFSGFSELSCKDKDLKDQLSSAESMLSPRTSHYDTFSVDSSPVHTPPSHSPCSPAIRNSPQSPSTDTSEFEEFLSKPRKFLERDFSELTLTDIEQQELLQAAKIIQNAYRQFKMRKKQHVDELKAAVLIQSYYRRYKQFALYRRITKAAVLIQNSYRAYKEHEQFKKSRHAAAVIQNYFRHYRKRKQRHAEEDAPGKRLETKYRKPSYGK